MFAKPIAPNKFWIVERSGARVGTIHRSQDAFKLTMSDTGHESVHVSLEDITEQMGISFGVASDAVLPVTSKQTEPLDMVLGFPVKCTHAFNVQEIDSVPVFTKVAKSKAFYAAGYYAIRYPYGWLQSFCPRLATVKEYQHVGPYRNESDLKLAVRRAKGEETE